jgi:hypothetical protein
MKERIKTKNGFLQIPITIWILLVIVAIGIGYGTGEYFKTSKIIKETEELTKEEKYDEAIKELEFLKNKLFGKILSQKISAELEKNKKLLEDKTEYTQGIEEFNKGNWEKAKDLLSKVSEISPYYQDAKSKIEEIQNKIINEKIAEAVNKAKTEIRNQQNTQSIENPPLSQNNQNQKEQNNSKEQSNEITSADLQKILPYIGFISCGASNLYGDYIASEGSASLWVLKGKGAFILTNYHVIEPTIGSYRAGCVVWLDKGCYVVDIQRIPSSASDNFLDFAFLKITSTCHCNSSDCLQFPPPESLSSEELFSIPPCPTKMPLGSPVAVIGYPITTKSRIDFENLFGQQESALVPNKTVTTGIISAHDSNPIYNGYSDVNYFVSAKIDKGNSGGLAFSKYNGQLCILGVPTWVERGYFENMGVVQSFHNIWNF